MDFEAKYRIWVEEINGALDLLTAERDVPERNIYKAMRYSLVSGGKRLRPVISMAVCEMLGGDPEQVKPFACALEMIHTYSLIHDDLPAMDNDDFRRGRPTNHKVFGEAAAILAGDALLNLAFEVMLEFSLKKGGSLENKVRAMKIIAEASGTRGMIGGQVVDLEAQGRVIEEELLEYMHRCKTGALIKAAVMSAAVLCNAKESELDSLGTFADRIGLAFQIKDDILDVEGSFEDMGKSRGSDEANNKSTFVTIHGLDNSKKLLYSVSNQAVLALGSFGERSRFLKSLTEFLIVRKK